MACCDNETLARAVAGDKTVIAAYDAARGRYVCKAPSVTGGANTSKGGPRPFKLGGGK